MTMQSPEDLRQQLADQIRFLQKSAREYDQGDTAEAKRLATAIRLLVYDANTTVSARPRRQSQSLLAQLGMKDRLFLDSSSPQSSTSIISYAGLAGFTISGDTRTYVPNQNEYEARPIPFEQWWENVIIADLQRRPLTRRLLVLTMANQDGGAHVDPELDQVYAEICKTNVMGHEYSTGGDWQPLRGIETASVRQIAHEVLGTLEAEQPIAPRAASSFHGLTVNVTPFYATPPMTPHVTGPRRKVGRNERCPCGSGQKYKLCHGRT